MSELNDASQKRRLVLGRARECGGLGPDSKLRQLLLRQLIDHTHGLSICEAVLHHVRGQ